MTIGNSTKFHLLCMIFAIVSLPFFTQAAATLGANDPADRLAGEIQDLSSSCLPENLRVDAASMVRRYLQRRLTLANERSTAAWRNISDRDAWEAFSRPIIDRMRESLGRFPEPPEDLRLKVVGNVTGEGFRIEKLVFISRPGVHVTANLYMPAAPTAKMPGILICHSHHRPKEHGELQDMGMTWARAGCVVLVMDQLGHGERRQHGFATAQDFPRDFAVSRQDYYFRFDTGIQLQLVGESLIGWMAWDLMRGVDLLLQRDGVDPTKIVLLGAVAGGGDPAAVTAAIDDRISAVVPFNFGGPQPETRFPLPDDVETTFNYAGSGSWESTRNMRRSAADGFLPWVIVGSVAPRSLVFAHEFNWDRKRDPVWKRLQAIYKMYDASDQLAFTHGFGELKLRPPEASHCTHIGLYHRRLIHSAFRDWFAIELAADGEYRDRLDESKLRCMSAEVRRDVNPQLLHEVLRKLARKRLLAARQRRGQLTPEESQAALRQQLKRVIGDVEVEPEFVVLSSATSQLTEQVRVSRYTLQSEKGIAIPLLLLRPVLVESSAVPAVVIVAQAGKARLLDERTSEICRLLRRGVAVCLPDLRGIGETAVGRDRGRYSADTARSATQLMVGGTMTGGRLKDLRTVLAMLRRDAQIDARRIAVWGDSLNRPNPPEMTFKVPRRIDGRPKQSEPLGGLLALLAGAFEEDLRAVCSSGGLSSFQATLESSFVYIPADVVVPELLDLCDLDDIAAAIAPRPLRLSHVVDGWNRSVDSQKLQASMPIASERYLELDSEQKMVIDDPLPIADWLAEQLK